MTKKKEMFPIKKNVYDLLVERDMAIGAMNYSRASELAKLIKSLIKETLQDLEERVQKFLQKILLRVMQYATLKALPDYADQITVV